MTARGWVGFVSLVVAVGGAAVLYIQATRSRPTEEAFDRGDAVTPPTFEVAPTRPAARRTVVPALVGLHRREAWAKIGDAFLAVEATTEDAGPEKAGFVLWQDPPPNTKTTSGAIVKVRVGKAPEPATATK